jgi:UDP-3-O-[3-hydroxymyristoyl] glucosamine N-acyltransferase
LKHSEKDGLSYSLKTLAEMVGGEVKGDSSLLVTGLQTLQKAGSSELSFLANPTYAKYLDGSKAGAVILARKQAEEYPGNALIHSNPYLAYAKLSHLWDPLANIVADVAPSASIAESAFIAESVSIGPGAVICDDVRICEGVYIGANAYIGAGSVIGSGTRIYPNVVIYHGVEIGSACTIQAGAILGSDGFGFAPSESGWERISQLGGVRVGSRVEIGANTTIDRGALDDTVIEDGVILDNQIQIAHNVVIGENTAIAACSAVAGSTVIGKNCIVGGASGIAGHLEIADGVHITAMTMVIKSLPEPGVYSSGTGVQPNKDWKRSIARLRRLDSMESRVKSLEKQLMELGESKKG